MKNAREYYVPPPPGRYPSECVGAEAIDAETGAPLLSKNGSTMIKLSWKIAEGEHAGGEATDYIITDGNDPKAGGMGKIKLRGLGYDVDSDAEIPDTVICQQLLGRRQIVEFGNETMKSKESGFRDAMTVVDSKTGQTIELKKLTIKGYVSGLAAATGVQVQPIAQGAVVQQYAQPQQPQQVQQFQPAQFVPQVQQLPQQQLAPQQYAPQAQQLPAGVSYNPQGQLVNAQGQLVSLQPAPAMTQAAVVPQQAQQFYAPPQAAVPATWPPTNGATPTPALAADTTKKGKKNIKIQDESSGG